jgi:CBS-domain-containing membrane protein
MKVRDIMHVDMITVREDTTYEEVARMLHDMDRPKSIVVVDQKGNLYGVVSEKRLFEVLYPFYSSFYNHPESYNDPVEQEKKITELKDRKIKSFFNIKKTKSTRPDVPIMRLGGLMLAQRLHHIPVVENGKLVGIVSISDIYRHVRKNHLGF